MVQFRGYEDDALAGTLDLAHLRRIWPFVRPYRGGFGLCLLILLASFGFELLGPLLLRWTIDGPVSAAISGATADTSAVFWLGAGYLATTLSGIGLGYAYAMLAAHNGQRVIRDLRTNLFGHILQLSPGYFDRNPSGKLVTRVTTDVENLNELISTGVLQTFFDLLKIFGILTLLFWIDTRLALYAITATPIALLISLWFRRYARRAYRQVRGRLARQNAFLAEAVSGVRATRVFGREAVVQAHFDDLNRDTRVSWQATVLCFALFFAAVDLSLRWCQAGLLWIGGNEILDGAISAGVFVQFWMYFAKLTEPIRELGERYNVLQSAFASAERIFTILDQPTAPPTTPNPQPSTPGPARLRFDAVSFAYHEHNPVLQEVSLDIPPGTTCAIVGPTGAGKSTLLALAPRLYDPSDGQVSLDGIPLPQLDLHSLRRRIAIVQQDVFLFTGSVLDNLRLFDSSISASRVRDALRAVGALDFVEGLDGGLDAPVEERGVTFSQGERQLLSFARALVANPDLLILDEATANIDSAAELRIQRALRTLLEDRTCLVVAHRLSTVRDADQIVVLGHGQIIERGTDAELRQLDGCYAAMLRSLD